MPQGNATINKMYNFTIFLRNFYSFVHVELFVFFTIFFSIFKDRKTKKQISKNSKISFFSKKQKII